MTRFPPNVEQISVEPAAFGAWLRVRQNGTRMEFPLEPADIEHLIALLAHLTSPEPSA